MEEEIRQLDSAGPVPGLFPSAWAAEGGGPRRQKVVGTPGPAIQPGERLASTTRDTGAWPVLFVQREPGELYLQGCAGLAPGESPPCHRPAPAPGWVERVDPRTLEPLLRSPDLDSGGWLWCGGAVVHANGDLYVVNGRWCHRLDPELRIVAARELPVDAPHNGLLVLSDGTIATRNLGFRPDDRARFTLLHPDRLDIVGSLEVDARCMGRFSADRGAGGEHLYFTTPTEVRRLRYTSAGHSLELDPGWRADYAVTDADQSDAWDTSIGTDSVWLMDMGRPPQWPGFGDTPAAAPQRAFRFGLDDPGDRDVLDVIGASGAFNAGPPLYDPTRRIFVHYDPMAAVVVATRYHGPGRHEELWRRGDRSFVQMLCWADTGELVLEDAQVPGLTTDLPAADLVVVDIETGDELGRAPIGTPATLGMFLCPGWDRDVYVASIAGGIARVYVEP